MIDIKTKSPRERVRDRVSERGEKASEKMKNQLCTPTKVD